MQRTSYIRFALAAGMAASSIIALPAFAQTATTSQQGAWMNGQHMARPGVFGTVASVNGSTLTITSMTRGKPGTSNASGSNTANSGTETTYTVNAGSATVMKNGASSSLGSVAVGDRVSVQGTVSGQSVTATAINDGMLQGGMRNGGTGMGAMTGFKGDGKPVIGGTISGVSGSTLTVTNSGSNAYTVDASSATVLRMGATSTVSAILSGDRVLVQGTVSGQDVTATAVIDQGQPQASTTSKAGKGSDGILAGIGGFFKKLFSFF